MGREDEIRLIAYTIWEEEGCVNGHDCEHWIRAETIWEENQNEGASPATARKQPKRMSKQDKTKVSKTKVTESKKR